MLKTCLLVAVPVDCMLVDCVLARVYFNLRGWAQVPVRDYVALSDAMPLLSVLVVVRPLWVLVYPFVVTGKARSEYTLWLGMRIYR